MPDERLHKQIAQSPTIGAGIGASHQTGWTALSARLLQKLGEEA